MKKSEELFEKMTAYSELYSEALSKDLKQAAEVYQKRAMEIQQDYKQALIDERSQKNE